MTSTTAAAAALAAGEHLVHRPRGVVHLYRGALTASGRFAKAGPACGQRTNRLVVLEPPAAGPLDPAWTRRLCTRCEQLLSPTPARVTATDWDTWAEGLTLDELYASVRFAETLTEVDRVVHVALRTVGYRTASSVSVGRDRLTLLQHIAARRTALDTEAAEARDAQDAGLRDHHRRVEKSDRYAAVVEAQNLATDSQNPVDRIRAKRAAAAYVRDHQPAAS